MVKRSLNIPQEFLCMILNEQTGYFYQLEGWNLNCVIVGAVLADLALKSRIDSDEQSLILLSETKTGNPILDPCLETIAAHSGPQKDTRYWIEQLTVHSETIISDTLKSLVDLGVLKHYEGEFYTIEESARHGESKENHTGKKVDPYVKARIRKAIFTDTIPDPEDSFIIGLLNACNVLPLIFEIDEENEKRIEWICNTELINRDISAAVKQTIITPRLRQTFLTRKIPKIPLKSILSNQQFRDGNLPALFGSLAEQYGPVFQISVPFQKTRTFMAGPEINQWTSRNARRFMTSGNFFRDVEKACGANGLIPSLDGAEHFQFRKLMAKIYSTARIDERLDELCRLNQQFMISGNWQEGSELEVQRDARLMINLQMFQLLLSTNAQDLFEDLVKWNERAIICHVGDLLPKFLLHTPAMKRRFRLYDELLQRIEQNHTPYQRADAMQGLGDDLISLHSNDPQFLPEQNLPFMLAVTPVFQSIYLGDSLGFALFEMARQPELAAKICKEANAIFDAGGLCGSNFSLDKCDTTRRFIMECLRKYPIIPMVVRNVANSCVVENYSLPLGERLFIIQSASHYMNCSFPDPYKFDIDRYLPSRKEHHGSGYAPFGLDTHKCMGQIWVRFQLILTLLNIAYHFEFVPLPRNYRLKINPVPGLSVTRKLKLRIAKQLHELPTT